MKERLILFFVLTFLIYNSLIAIYHKIGHCGDPFWCRDLELIESTILVPDSLGINIIDVTEPDNPIYLDCFRTNENCLEIEVSGNIAYIANSYDGLLILDITNPRSPEYLGNFDTSGAVISVTIENSIAYIAKNDYELQIIDVSDSANPVLLGSLNEIYISTMEFYENILIATNFAGGVFLIDVTNPTEPILLDNIGNFPEELNDIEIIDSIAYITGKDNFYIYDFSNIEALELISFCKVDFASEITINNNKAYVVCGYNGVYVIDISDILSPEIISFFDTPRCAASLEYKDNIAYVSDLYTGLEIYDLSIPSNPYIVGSVDTPHMAISTSISDNMVYTVDNESYLQIIDMNDLSSPYIVNSYGLFYQINDFHIEEDMGYALTGSRLYSLDLDNLLYPEVIDYLEIGNANNSFVINDSYAFVMRFFEKLTIVNLENPLHPYLLSSCNIPQTRLYDLAVSGNYVYVAGGTKGIQIVNIADINNPIFIPNLTYDNFGEVYGIEIKNDILFLTCGYDGLDIVNISNPTQPQLLQTFKNHQDSKFIRKPIIIGNTLFAEDNNWNELLSFDISDPENTELCEKYILNQKSYDLNYIDNHLITANGYHGISILNLDEFSETEDSFLADDVYGLSNYPNPFNPTTTLKFNIQNDAKIKLSVFNIKGQKIKTLINDYIIKGSHTITWHGDNESGKKVSSGVYFYKLNVNSKLEAVKKCLLLK